AKINSDKIASTKKTLSTIGSKLLKLQGLGSATSPQVRATLLEILQEADLDQEYLERASCRIVGAETHASLQAQKQIYRVEFTSLPEGLRVLAMEKEKLLKGYGSMYFACPPADAPRTPCIVDLAAGTYYVVLAPDFDRPYPFGAF